MAKAFWKGIISFGMVAIPVRMSLATKSKTPGFHFLHNKCLTRPKQVLYCPMDEEYFSVKDAVRGYEYAKEQYIVFKESDFDKVPVRSTHAIEILGFVGAGEIDPIYYSASHYLEPEELGVKPFSLLRTVLLKKKRIGIAKVAFQIKEHLCCLRPLDEILALHTLHYQDEVLPAGELAPEKPELKADELEMASRLVEAMAREFKPVEYRDEYSLALKKMVEAKVKGQAIKAPEKAPEVEIADLMTALKESVAAAGKR